MKTDITLIGITEMHEKYYEYMILPVMERSIKYIKNPTSFNILYPIVEPIKTGFILPTDFINATRIKSYELKNLLIYED